MITIPHYKAGIMVLFSLEESVNKLGISLSELEDLMYEENIPGCRIGNDIFFFEAWIEALKLCKDKKDFDEVSLECRNFYNSEKSYQSFGSESLKVILSHIGCKMFNYILIKRNVRDIAVSYTHLTLPTKRIV